MLALTPSVLPGTAVVNSLRATNEMTISGWLNPSFLRPGEGAGTRHAIFAAGTQLQIGLENEGQFYITIWNPKTEPANWQGSVFGGTPVGVGQFVHFAVTYENDPDGFGDDVVTLYLNGEFQAEHFVFPTLDQLPITDGAQGQLGRSFGWQDTARDFDGTLSDVGLWAGRALTPQEIALVGGMGRAGQSLASVEIDSLATVFATQSGSVTTGAWEWSYTTNFATPADGSPLALGKHFYGQDKNVYVVLDGASGSWTGVKATGGEPFAIPILITGEPQDQAVNLGQSAGFQVEAETVNAVAFQWYFAVRAGGPYVEVLNATEATLTLPNVEAGQHGWYYCLISEIEGDESARTRDARLLISDKPASLVEHWLLNDTPTDLAILDPAHEPVDDHATRAPLINEISGGGGSFYKGTTVGAPAPLSGGPSRSPVSTGSIGSGFRESHIALGNLAPGVEPFSIAFWFNRDGGGSRAGIGDQQHLINSNSGQANRWNLIVYELNPTSGVFSLGMFHNGGRFGPAGEDFYVFASGLTSDAWYHCALTRAPDGTFTVYLNGEAIHTGTNTANFSAAPQGLVMGNDPYRADRHFLGYFDDIRIYDGLLNQDEVKSLIADEVFEIAMTQQPEDQFLNLGETAVFNVAVEATGPVDYQWYSRQGPAGTPELIAGENAAILTLENSKVEDERFYLCRIYERGGDVWVQTRNARLGILDKPVNLIHHWRLNETAGDAEFARLDPNHLPEEGRLTEATVSAAVGPDARFLKGGSVGDPPPRYSGPASTDALSAAGSTASLGTNIPAAGIALGNVAPGLEPFTMALWFNRNGSASTEGLSSQFHILGANQGQLGRWNLYAHGVSNGTFSLALFHSGGGFGPAGEDNHVLATGLQSDTWFHFAATRDIQGNFTLYLDGVAVHSGTNLANFSNAPSSLGGGVFVGRRPNTSVDSFLGLFDDIRFYDGALGSQEIASLLTDGEEPPSGYGAWAASFGLDAGSDGAPGANPAGDNVSNLLKYSFGMDPTAPAPRGGLPVAGNGEGGPTLTYTRLKAAADLTYVINFSTDLMLWAPTAVEELQVEDRGETERVKVRVPALDGKLQGFLQLRVSLIAAE